VDGHPLRQRSPINQALFTRGARYLGEMLRLYGDGDPFYPFSHSRENFAAFQAAGGKVSSLSFHLTQPPTVTRSYGTPACGGRSWMII
jgi:hypothetical protein